MNATDTLEHPPGSILVAYGLGQLPDAELASIDIHLADCPECRQVVEGVVPDTLLNLLRAADTDADSLSLDSPAPAAKPNAPPAELLAHPRYRVGELLGIGGMGAVYKAEHLLMERPVALKVLNRKLIDNPATTDRFRREVRAAARLTHPNIVAAFDAEQAGDVHFLAMEFVEGVSLARLAVEKGPLPVAEACDYIRQAALGLQHAHDRGMVHRDIKPQNLMLTPAGQIKILDFGLARFVMESAPADTSLSLEAEPAAGNEAAIRLTHTGLVMGTPDYIAPEQARDSHLADIRADIYSLGCTLYDLLAGQAPFPDGNAVHKVRGHLSRTPQPLDNLRRDVPPELVRILDRMMAKDPANRFQTPADVAAALTPFVSAPPPRRKRWPALAACFAFLALLLGGAIIYVQTDNGRIVIETNDDKIAVMIQKAGGVKIIDQATGREYRLQPGEHTKPSGDYLIDVTEPLAGLEFQTKKFELKRGKEVRLTAKFVVDGAGEKKLVGAAPKGLAGQNETFAQWAEMDFRRRDLNGDGRLDLNEMPQKLRSQLGQWDSDGDGSIDLEEYKTYFSARIVAGTEFPAADAKQPQSDEGFYQGKPAREWLHQFEDSDPERRKLAIRALGAIAPKNPKLIPVLITALRDDDDSVGYEASAALRKLGPGAFPAILEILSDKKNIVAHERMTAALTMDLVNNFPPPGAGGGLGRFPGGVGALGGLGALGGNGPFGAGNLGTIPGGYAVNPAPLPLLMETLRVDDPNVRIETLRALGGHRENAKLAIPKLVFLFGQSVTVLEDTLKKGDPIQAAGPSVVLPILILETIVNIEPETEKILADDIAVDLDRKNLAKIVPQWRAKYRVLAEAFPLAEPFPRPITQPKMGKTEGASKNVPSMEEGTYQGKPSRYWLNQLEDGDPKFRVDSVRAIGGIAQKNPSLIPVLVSALRDSDDGVGHEAAWALRSAGEPAFPAILEILRDKKLIVARERMLVALGIDGRPADNPPSTAGNLSSNTSNPAPVPLLISALNVRDSEVREQTIQALGHHKERAQPAVPKLVEVLGEFVVGLETISKSGKTIDESLPDNQNLGFVLRCISDIDENARKSIERANEAAGKMTSEDKRLPIWRNLYESLAKTFPSPQAVKDDLAHKQTASDEDFYQGKPASFWLNQLRDGDPEFRIEAVKSIGGIARSNEKYMPILIRAMEDPDEIVAFMAARELGASGEKAWPALAAVFHNSESSIAMRYAILAVGHMGASAPLYLGKPASFWMNQYQDASPKLRIEAIEALGNLAAKDKKLVPFLVAGLRDRETLLRVKSSEILGNLGPDALPEILARVDRTSPRELTLAADAIRAYGPQGKSAVPMLAQSLKLQDWPLRRAVVRTLESMGSDAKAAVPSLVEVLGAALDLGETVEATEKTDNRRIQSASITKALLAIDPEIGDVLPKGIRDSTNSLRGLEGINYAVSHAVWKQAYDALKARYPQPASDPSPANNPPPVPPKLEPGGNPAPKQAVNGVDPRYRNKSAAEWRIQLQDFDPKLRVEAVAALGSLAAANKELVPELVACFKDKSALVRMKAASILRSLGPTVLPAILSGIDRKSPTEMVHAAEIIAQFGERGAAAVPLLTEALSFRDWTVQMSASRALGRIGTESKLALPALVQVLGERLKAENKKRDIPETKGDATLVDMSGFTAPDSPLAQLAEVIQRIDPGVNGVLPAGLYKNGVRTVGADVREMPALWQQTYEVLQKRYPQPTNDPPAAPPKVERGS